jgi:hypothetical protein
VRRVSRWAAIAAIAALSLTACAGSDGPQDPPSPTGRSTTAVDPAATDAWLAALRIERDPDALDEDTQALTEPLGRSLVVSPASCFEGLPSDVASSTYVLGAVAPTRDELDGLLAGIDREPLFEVEVRVRCSD